MFFTKLRSRAFFSRMYGDYVGDGICMMAKAPRYFNIALPDFSVQYFVASFKSTEDVVLTGTVPQDHVLYYSIVVYDTYGMPHPAINDTQLDKNFTYKLKAPPGTFYYCVIVRMYLDPIGAKKIQSSLVPEMTINGKEVKKLSQVQIKKNTDDLEAEFYGFLSKRSLPPGPKLKDHQFFMPPFVRLAQLFPNPDSVYLASFPFQSRVFRITGTLPDNIGRSSNLRFFGFMACNLQTTGTDSAITFYDLAKKYTFWLAYSKKEAVKAGYKGDVPLLLFHDDNTAPFLVCRLVFVNNHPLKPAALKDKEKPNLPDVCKRIMKNTYPKVEALA